MIILCANLTSLRNAKIASKTLFLGGCVKVSLEEISIWINRLSIKDHPHQYKWAWPNPLTVWAEQKGRGSVNSLSLLELRYLCSPTFGHLHSCPWTIDLILGLMLCASHFLGLRLTLLASLGPKSLDLDWITTPSAFWVLQLIDGRSQDFFYLHNLLSQFL